MGKQVGMVVIGAGWAGLYAAKYAREAGLSVAILEARSDLGGVWNYSDDPDTITVMKNTVSSSSRHVTEASDFSMGADAGNFFGHEDALRYLRAYADRFDLTRDIVFGARVCTAEKDGDLWVVRTQDGRSFAAARLSICTGVHQRRRPITGPVLDFTGRCMHAGDIKHPGDLDLGPEDHVVIYGGGETAADIVHDLAKGTEARITWAIRGGQHFFRKAPLRKGRPPGHYDRNDMALDEYSSSLLTALTAPEDGKPGMRHRCNVATSGSVFSYQGHGVAEWVNDIPWFRQFFNKNAHALEHVWNGRVAPAPAIRGCADSRLTFDNEATCEATHIICCFGYEGDVSFLPEAQRRVPMDQLYRLVFHPDDPSLAFFGFARPTILSLPYMIELQCHYAKEVWSGALPLPDRDTRHAEACADAETLDAFFGYERSNKNITCPFWYTQLILRLVGREPTESRVFFKRFSPRKDWRMFSRVLRVPLSPLLIRLMVGDHGLDEDRRINEYISPMPFGFRRKPGVSMPRYALAYGLAVGLPRLLALDSLFDWIAKRRIARHGRSIGLRAKTPAAPHLQSGGSS